MSPGPAEPGTRSRLASLLDHPGVARVLAALGRGGEETRIVGGAVRNALLGRPVADIDLATTALPEATVKAGRRAGLKTVPTGIEHGTVTIVVEGRPFEVTTLREDVETDGRHARVRFGRDFAADARRRDFTMNALSLGPDGALHDTVGGLADLAAGRVRFIGEARARIREDYLRTLRFFRFSAEYAEGPLDPDGLAAAVAERDGLAILSAERVRAELLKLLAARRAVPVVAELSESGLLARLTGGVADLGRLARAAASDAARPDPVLRLFALLVRTTEDADRLRARLRLSNAEHERLAILAAAATRLRSRDAPLDAAECRRAAVLFGAAPLAAAAAVTAGEPRPLVTSEAAALIARYADGSEGAPVFRLTGADLLAQGTPPGREIGRRLAEAREAWLAAGCPNE